MSERRAKLVWAIPSVSRLDRRSIVKNLRIMTKKETFKWIVQIIASIATAILTAMGTVSCIGY